MNSDFRPLIIFVDVLESLSKLDFLVVISTTGDGSEY
jgi:hypothetical protein